MIGYRNRYKQEVRLHEDETSKPTEFFRTHGEG
jgi:hypothetical protein